MQGLRKRFQGFTLIETIITVVIMSLLIGIVFEVFVIVGRIAVFVQSQKGVHNEMIYVTQAIQNLVDDQTVVMTGFDSVVDSITKGFDIELELADETHTYTFSRACESGGICYIELEKQLIDFTPGVDFPEYIAMTNTNFIHVNSFTIKKLPFTAESTFEDIMHDGFWMFIDVEIPNYSDENRWFAVDYQIQMFFNMRKY